jgi:hypothetical protein
MGGVIESTYTHTHTTWNVLANVSGFVYNLRMSAGPEAGHGSRGMSWCHSNLIPWQVWLENRAPQSDRNPSTKERSQFGSLRT